MFNFSNGEYTTEKYNLSIQLLETHDKGVKGAGLGPFGLFHVWMIAPRTDDGRRVKGVVVAHEMNWLEGKRSYRQYSSGYEAIQQKLGVNLRFICKEHSQTLGRALFRYDFENPMRPGLLFTPATGEELYFEIYGIDESYGILRLMFKGEA